MSSKRIERSMSDENAATLEPCGFAGAGKADGEHHVAFGSGGAACCFGCGRRSGRRLGLGFDFDAAGFVGGSGGNVGRAEGSGFRRWHCLIFWVAGPPLGRGGELFLPRAPPLVRGGGGGGG